MSIVFLKGDLPNDFCQSYTKATCMADNQFSNNQVMILLHNKVTRAWVWEILLSLCMHDLAHVLFVKFNGFILHPEASIPSKSTEMHVK